MWNDIENWPGCIKKQEDNTRIQNLVREVNRLPMTRVLAHYGVKFVRNTGNRALAMCPMHAASKVGSFSVNVGKNLCWCFACQQGGSNVKTYQTMFDVDEKTAVLQIACDFELITKAEFQKLSEVEYQKIEAKYTDSQIARPKPVYKKDVLKIRTDTYEFMRDYFGLSEEHKQYLLTTRNLEPDRIQSDYFTMDTKLNPEKGEAFCREFLKQFPEYASKITQIPGIFERKDRLRNKWIPTLMLFDGIGILIRDADRNVLGVQIRMTEPDMNGVRYKFMSCDFGDGSKGINRGGSTCGTPIDVVFPKRITKHTMVCIAEGRFKTEILRQQDCIGISIQGVNNYYGIELTIKAIEEKIGRPIKELYTFYDADLVENMQVFKALIGLSEYLKTERPDLDLYQVVWREESGKGIDDCILAGNRNTVHPVAMDDMKQIYERASKEAALLSELDGVKPVKMSKEDRKRLAGAFKILVCESLFE